MDLTDILFPFFKHAAKQIRVTGQKKARRNPSIRPALDVFTQLTRAIEQEHAMKEKQRRAELKEATRPGPRSPRRAAAPDGPTPDAPPAIHGLQSFLLDAAVFMQEHSGIPAPEILASPGKRREAYRLAVKRLHPDAGGSEADMQTLTAYWRALKVLDELKA